MGAPGICSEPNGAPGFAQPNGGFTGLTVGARELTHRIVLCKTFIYIYTILWTVRPYSRCWVKMTSDLWLWLFYPESISVLSSQIFVIHPRRGGSRSERHTYICHKKLHSARTPLDRSRRFNLSCTFEQMKNCAKFKSSERTTIHFFGKF
jgi:hypothetical protein